MINQLMLRDYEVSIWTLQDDFLAVLKYFNTENKGQIQNPLQGIKNDGTLTVSFSIPMYIQDGAKTIINPIWYNVRNGNLMANLRKIKVIFNNAEKNDDIFEFLIVKVQEEHNGYELSCHVECEGLAFHELGKIGYAFSLNQDTFLADVEEWKKSSSLEDLKCNINYWCDKLLVNTRWKYEIIMDWSSYDGIITNYDTLNDADKAQFNLNRSNNGLRRNDTIYEDEYISSWENNNGQLIPTSKVSLKEKERLIEIEESNIYNITQKIAETFGVFCKYIYLHDSNYHIIERKVIFYNNFLYESNGALDITYHYNTSNLSREMDGTDTITKMYVKTLEDGNTESGLATIMDTDANKSQENYLLNFDYLRLVGNINDEQYSEVKYYEAQLHDINQNLKIYENQLITFQEQLLDAQSKEKIAKDAIGLDQERIGATNDLLNSITGGDSVVEVTSARPDYCAVLDIDDNNNYINLRQKGIIANTIHVYSQYNAGAQTLSNDISSYSIIYDEFNNIIKLNFSPKLNFNTVYVIYNYVPQLYYENIRKVWEARLFKDQNEYNVQHVIVEKLQQLINNVEIEQTAALTQKEQIINNFNYLLGPAIREGYWQPEDIYSKYGENHKEELSLNAQSSFNSNLASLGWDNQLFDNEQTLSYEIGVQQTTQYYPCIDLSNYMGIIALYKDNLSQLSFIFQTVSELPNGTNDDIRYLQFFSIGSKSQLMFIRNGNNNVIPVLMLTGAKELANIELIHQEPRIGILTTNIESGTVHTNITTLIPSNNINFISNLETYTAVYPRIKITSANLKKNENELIIYCGNTLLNNYSDYYILGRKDEILNTSIYCNYITIKPELIFSQGTINNNFKCIYMLSNSGLFMYLDAIQVLKENSMPKVSYSIKPTYLNENFIKYSYRYLNRICHINDYELKFENVQGYISELKLDLDHPDKDEIIISNYKNKFEDLFSTIVAQSEQMQKNSTIIGMAAQLFTTTGEIKSSALQSVMNRVDLNYAFNDGKLTIDEDNGIWGTSDSGVVAFRGGGIFTATEKDDNGDWIWNTGILPSGINASLITTGQLDTNLIRVFAGNDLKFQLNGDGLYAYRSWWDYENNDNAPATINRRDDGLDFGQYVVHNSEGLFLTAKQGTILNGKTLEQDVNRVEVSWDGLIIRNLNNNPVFYADTNGNLNIAGRITATSLSIQSEAVNQLDGFIANSNTVVNVIPGLIQTRIQNIEIGGINLIPSRRGTIWTTEKGVFINYDYGNHYYSQGKYRIEFNSVDAPLPDYNAVIWLSGVSMTEGDYTLSFWCWREGINDSVNPAPKITTELRENNTRYKIFNDGEFYPNSNTPHKYELHVHMDEDKILNLGFIISNLWTDTNAHVYITDVKLEKGIHATQWSAASEDIMDIDRRVTINTSTITQTANEIRAEVKAITIGGTNLLLNSKETVESANYLLKEYNIVTYAQEDFENGELYTIQIKGTLGQGKTEFHIYNSNDYVFMCALTADDYNAKTGIYTKTFEWTNTRSGYVGDNSKILIYAIPSEVTINSTIEWVKLEKGNKPTAWSPASEDIETRVSSISETADNIKTSVERWIGNVPSARSIIDQTSDSITSAVSSIEIGGTNLVQSNEGSIWTLNAHVDYTWSDNYYSHGKYGIIFDAVSEPIPPFPQEGSFSAVAFLNEIDMEAGNYVLSFWCWRYNTNTTPQIDAELRLNDSPIMTIGSITLQEDTPTRHVFQFELTESNKLALYFIASNLWQTGNVSISDVKLEKGTKATTWSLAPGDTEEEIAALTTRIYTAEQQILPDAIISTVRSSQQYTTDLNGKANVSDLNGKADASELAKYSTLRQTADDISAAVDAIDEFHAGTVVTITAQQTKIATPIFEVDISNSDEQLKLDEGGGVMTNLSVTEYIEAPNIAERYTGKYGRVEIGSNGDYSNYLEFADAVSDKIILEDIDVWSEADFYGVLYLHGIHGSGNITIHMNYDDDNDVNAYHSQIGLRNNGVVIVFDGCCFKANISVEGQTTVKFTNCFFKAGAASCLSMFDGVTAWMDGCTLNGTGNLIELVRGVHLSAQNIAGTTTTTGNFIFARFATICWYGTRPQGRNDTAISLTTPSDLSTLTIDPGDGGPLISPEPITVALTATLTDTYYWTSDDSDTGWSVGWLIQGIHGYRHAAVMWFNTNAFTGKTIKNATLTIKRISGEGRTTYVGMPLYTTPLGGNDGNPRTGSVSYGDVGQIANGETKMVTLPVAAIQAIADGTMKGLMLWPNDTAVLDGREYSANYARFDTGTAPVLTVTYQ